MPVAMAERAASEAPDIIRLGDVRFAWPGRGAFSLAVETLNILVKTKRQRLSKIDKTDVEQP